MNYLSNKLLLTICFCLVITKLYPQTKLRITGTVSDAKTKAPLPFASIALQKHLIGTACNEEGQFEFYIPNDSIADSLMISYLGYIHKSIDIRTINGPLIIKLETSSVELSEVVIRPLLPTYYIKMAMNRLKENYTDKPFISEAYYREIFMENENYIRSDEGIFRTYFPDFQDTVQNQHQLILYRQAHSPNDMTFMSEKRKKKQLKAQKKETKKGDEKKEGDAIDFSKLFGGPKLALDIAKIDSKGGEFLDSNNFKHYTYTFGPSSTYDNQEIIKIDFESKGTTDHVESSGSIFIDLNSYAFVKINFSGEFKIPILYKPVILLMGIKLENPTFDTETENQFIEGHWYPKNVRFNINIKVAQIHWFSPDDHAAFKIEEIYNVNKIQLNSISPIPLIKRYNPEKKMEEQVFNDDKLTWDGINIIKKQ